MNIHRQVSWLHGAVLAGGLAWAAIAPAQTLDFGSCVRIEDLSARLSCYDRAAGRAPSSAAPAAAPAVAPAAPAAPPAPPAPRPATAPTASAPAVLPAPVSAPPAPQPGAPVAAKDPVAEFGASSRPADALTARKMKEESGEVRQIEARVTAVRKRPAGEQVLTLDNGQVWTQTETREFPQFAVGDVVVIRRAMLGSFLLTLQKGSPSTRVQRIS